MGCWRKLNSLLFPHDFSQSCHRGDRCLSTSRSYTFFRIFMLLLYAVDFSYYAWFYTSRDLLYFTNWGLLLTLICALILLIENLANYSTRIKSKYKFWKISHFIFTIAFVFQMFITIMYWCAIFPYAVAHLWDIMSPYDIVNPIMAHGVPIILLSIDLQFNLVVVWNMAYVPFEYLLITVYLVVNWIYTLLVSPIYDPLTFRNWFSLLFVFGSAVVMILCHVLVRLYCRRWKEKRVLEILQSEKMKDSLIGSRIGQKDYIDTTVEDV